jgi:hypothetical protein
LTDNENRPHEDVWEGKRAELGVTFTFPVTFSKEEMLRSRTNQRLHFKKLKKGAK